MKKTSPWLSVCACLLTDLCIGILYVWSVLKADAVAYYGWSDGAANLVASFMLFAFCVGNLLGGALNDRIGPKKVSYAGVLLFCVGIFLASCLPSGSSAVWFYICYCIVGGIGSGGAYGAILSCIQKWFPHKRGFATGLSTAAFGLGTVVFSPVIAAMLNRMEISSVLRVLSIVFVVVGMLCCTLIRQPDETYLASLHHSDAGSGAPGTSRDMTPGQVLRTAPFWCLFFSMFFYNGTWNMLNPLIKGLGVARGLSDAAAVLCVSLTGLPNAAGRFTMASLSDRLGRIRTNVLLSVLTILCAAALIAVGGYGYFAVVLLTAFAYGGPSAVNPAACTDFFGTRYSGTNYGIAMLGLGFSSLFFNAVSNALFASTGSYTMTFLMGGVSAAVSIVLLLAMGGTAKILNQDQTSCAE